MSELIFDSRDPRHRPAFGAVPAGSVTVFRAAVAGDAVPSLRVFLADMWDAPVFSASMEPCGELQGLPLYEARFTPKSPALMFYDFTLDGAVWRRGPGGRAVSDLCEHYQLTVYDGAVPPPRSFAGGVMYQIFPDRFARGEGCGSCPFPDRHYHADMSDLPDWSVTAPDLINKDYFGGSLRGIESRLDRLVELSVTCVYLNPIFESHSNHRYDTADYMKIDPLLGTEEDLQSLCAAAKARGISIVIDGVFNHTGADSRYFDLYGRYGGHGAYSRSGGPFDNWYDFGEQYPCGYRAWWDFPNLPAVNHSDPGYREFICGEGGVIDHWLSAGVSGIRLDVADELSDNFISDIRRAVKRHGDDKLLLGEVWEDASNKLAYGVRRRYFLGDGLDCAMGYPFRDALLPWLRSGCGDPGEDFWRICENYPAPALDLSMNMLSTHDTVRALTALGCEDSAGQGRDWQEAHHIPSPQEYDRGRALLLLAFAVQYTLPGISSIYYGDEAGMYGYRDPFNRCFYPWGREDPLLLDSAKALGRLRRENPVLKDGAFRALMCDESLLCFERRGESGRLLTAVNRSDRARRLPAEFEHGEVLYGSGSEHGVLAPLSPVILRQ